MHGEVGGTVKKKKTRPKGLEPVTWTHSCISCHGCEHSPPLGAGQPSARGAASYNHKGPSEIIEVLVNSIEAVSVTVMTIENKWECSCDVQVRRSGRL